MFDLHLAEDRNLFTHKGLIRYRSFSDGDYLDYSRIDYSVLQTLNEDIVLKGTQFSQRHHENIEILTYVLKGTLVHTDDLGTQQVIPAGSFQLLTAGTGIKHIESNGSAEEDLHFIELSITPNQIGIRPGYQQRNFKMNEEIENNFELIASSRPGATALFLNQDAHIYRFRIDRNCEFELSRGNDSHKAYIYLTSGKVNLSDSVSTVGLKPGDGLGCSDVEQINFTQDSNAIAEGLLILLPPEF